MKPLLHPKYWLTITTFFSLFILQALGQPAFVTNGLVAYYPFNGNANDESGSRNLKNEFNQTIAFNTGVVNKSAVFDINSSRGVNYFNTESKSLLTDFTVTTWVKLKTIDRWPEWMYLFHSGNSFVRIGVNNVYQNHTQIVDFGEGIVNSYLRSPRVDAIQPDKWFSLGVSKSNGLVKIYINGILLAQGEPLGLNPEFDLNNIRIGNEGGYSYAFDGELDEFRVYNRALTDMEVKNLYGYESNPLGFAVNLQIENAAKSSGLGGFYVYRMPETSGYTVVLQDGLPLKVGWHTAIVTYGSPFALSLGDQIEFGGPLYNDYKNITFENPKNVLKILPNGDRAYKTRFNVLAQGEASFRLAFYGQPSLLIRKVSIIRESDGVEVVNDSSLTGDGKHWVGNWDGAINYNDAVGRVETTPSGLHYDFGDIVVFKATPTKAFEFSNWTVNGVDAGSANPLTITIDSPITIKAIFTEPKVKPPIFAVQPKSQSLNISDDVSFCAAMKDEGEYSYQWQIDEQNIPGATQNCYTINGLPPSMNGRRFRVIVSNTAGTITSETATLSVLAPVATRVINGSIDKGIGGAVLKKPLSGGYGRARQSSPEINFKAGLYKTEIVVDGDYVYRSVWDQLGELYFPGEAEIVSRTAGINNLGQTVLRQEWNVKKDTVGFLALALFGYGKVTVRKVNLFNALDGVQLLKDPNLTGEGGFWKGDNAVVAGPGLTNNTLDFALAIGQIETTPNQSAFSLGSQVSLKAIPTWPFQFSHWTVDGVTIGTANPLTFTVDSSKTVNAVFILKDADGDNLSDYEEALVGTDPNKPDTDGDGLGDAVEVNTRRTNPLNPDTDGDGYSDGIEVAKDGDPNNANIKPTGALAIFPAVDVEFYTVNGVKYQLEVSKDMIQWTPQGSPVVGNGGNQNHLVRVGEDPSFWRLKVVP